MRFTFGEVSTTAEIEAVSEARKEFQRRPELAKTFSGSAWPTAAQMAAAENIYIRGCLKNHKDNAKK